MVKQSKNTQLAYTQDNELVTAAYTMTIDERRILMLAMSKIGCPRDRTPATEPGPEPLTFDLYVSEWIEHFGNAETAYRNMKAASKRLKRRDVIFKNKDYEEDVMWCDSIRYIESEGRIRLRFGWTLSHYLLGMTEQFTKANIVDIRELSSVHSVRIYEMCSQFRKPTNGRNYGYKITTIIDLKKSLCLDNKYKAFKDFRLYVIEPAIKEINKNTDLKIKVSYLKKGRAYDKIEFIIKEKPRKSEQQLELDVDSRTAAQKKQALRERISDVEDTAW